ncbi:hypothetical protein BDN72DRAFT_848985 [Pluteus cervinus]|uniref:Uncharacterized protein n=1 Tax=Pluteus cervinus TaxID=181527 RepID=A0ACD3AA06_9AGAR|nr:hypothetical protein BDN72DRAFT_848985 [Pluteus cervinus]
MDRILALPDLAGLSTVRKRPKIPTPQSSSPRSPKRVKPEQIERPPVPPFAPRTPKKYRPQKVKKPPSESTTQAPHRPSITFKVYSPSPPPPQFEDDWFDPITEWANSQSETLTGNAGDRTNDPSSDWDLEFDDSDRSISLPEYIYNQGDCCPASPGSSGYVQSKTKSCLVDYTSSSPLAGLQEAWEYSSPSSEPLDQLDEGQYPNFRPAVYPQACDEALRINGNEADMTSLPGGGIDESGAAVSIFDMESPWDAIGNILGFSRTGAGETVFHQEIGSAEDYPIHDRMIEPREDDTHTVSASSQRYTDPHEETHHTPKLGFGHPKSDKDPFHAPDIMVRSASHDCRRPDTDPISQSSQNTGPAPNRLDGPLDLGEAESLMERNIPTPDSQLPYRPSEGLALRTAGAAPDPMSSVDIFLQGELESRGTPEPPMWNVATVFPKTPNTDRYSPSEGHEVEGTQIEVKVQAIGRLEDLCDVNQVNHGPALFLDFEESEEE